MNIIKQTKRFSRLRNARKAQHKTAILRDVFNSDLITYKEREYLSSSEGLFAFTHDDAYCKVSSDVSEMSVAAFDRKLKEEICPYFHIVFNNNITDNHTVHGHQVLFLVPWMSGAIHLFNVGRNCDEILPAESRLKIAEYRDEYNAPEIEAMHWRGWVAAWEGCREAYWKFENEGISPAMVLKDSEKERFKEAFSVIGFGNTLHEYADAIKTEEEKASVLEIAPEKEITNGQPI